MHNELHHESKFNLLTMCLFMISMGWFVNVPVTTLTLCLFMISMGWFVKVQVTTLTCESVYDIDGLIC